MTLIVSQMKRVKLNASIFGLRCWALVKGTLCQFFLLETPALPFEKVKLIFKNIAHILMLFAKAFSCARKFLNLITCASLCYILFFFAAVSQMMYF